MTASGAPVDAKLMLHAEHVDVVEVDKVRRTAIAIEVLLQDLEANSRWVSVAFDVIIHRTRNALRVRCSAGDGFAKVGGEGGDSTLPRFVASEECDPFRGLMRFYEANLVMPPHWHVAKESDRLAPMLVAQSKERYVREPRWAVHSGKLHLVVTVWDVETGLEAHTAYPFDGQLGEAVVLGPAFARVASGLADLTMSTHDAAVVCEAGAGASWVRVVAEGIREPATVWTGQGRAAAPTLSARGAEGHRWVGFHTDVRQDDGAADVARWIRLRMLGAAGQVLEPEAAMTDCALDMQGEEQSFEFPTLVVTPSGALRLFGRGSHRYWYQDLDDKGFGPRVPMGEGGWGCRGRRVAVHLTAEGRIWTARREREGIVIEGMDAPVGDAPWVVAVADPERAPLVPSRLENKKAFTADFRAWDGRRLYFGDLHQHSAHSDGCGTAAEVYQRARDGYEDDFAALSDHESFLGKRTGPLEWQTLQGIADAYDEPGRFASIYAYEWTGSMHPGPGHKCVYLPAASELPLSRDVYKTGESLLGALHELGGFAVPHHIGWTGADASAHDPRLQPVWEICSCHGCYEDRGHPLGFRGELLEHNVLAMLREGLRFGFIAASDSHGLLFHHGVGRKRDPWRMGLTCVQTDELSRQSVLAAIRQRRCYATSGAKIALDVRVEDAPMGGELNTGAANVRITIVARATSDAVFRRVVAMTPSGIAAQWEPGSQDFVIEVTVRRGNERCVYVRCEQDDGEMAWSSPVFF